MSNVTHKPLLTAHEPYCILAVTNCRQTLHFVSITTLKLFLHGSLDLDRRTLNARVYEWLLNAIVDLDFPPGMRLIETQLADQLGVSRLPIREALLQLEREQLVVIRPRRGAWVAPLTPRDAAEIYEVRMALEARAARLAAENASGDQIRAMAQALDQAARNIANKQLIVVGKPSAEFHTQVVVASGNQKLAAVLRSIGHHVARLRTVQVLSAEESTAQSALEGHRAIYEAIARRQAKRAERLMEEHIRIAYDRIVPLLESIPSEALKRPLEILPLLARDDTGLTDVSAG